MAYVPNPSMPIVVLSASCPQENCVLHPLCCALSKCLLENWSITGPPLCRWGCAQSHTSPSLLSLTLVRDSTGSRRTSSTWSRWTQCYQILAVLKTFKFWCWILLLTVFTLKCRRWNFKPSANSQDPEVVVLSQVHCGSFFDSKLETLRVMVMYTIWLHKTAFTSTVLAIPGAALAHTSIFFLLLALWQCYRKVRPKALLQIKT